MTLSDLFTGLRHALLFREYKGWVKGRDGYDFLWFLGQKVPLGLTHLEERMRENGQLPSYQRLTESLLRKKLNDRIETLNVAAAKMDIAHFIKNNWKLESWSVEYFLACAKQLTIAH